MQTSERGTAVSGWQRFVRAFAMAEPLGTPPLSTSMISLGIRAVFLGILGYAALQQVIGAVMGLLSPFEMVMGAEPIPLRQVGAGVGVTLTVAFLLASAAAVGVCTSAVGAVGLPEAAAVVADAQWPTTVLMLLAAASLSVSGVLAAGLALIGVVWGQAVMAHGLERLGAPYQVRVITQIGAVAAADATFWLILYLTLR